MEDTRERFHNLHEIVVAARAKLDRNTWDYLIGGAETETTVRRNRLALNSIAFRPRVLRNVASTDCRGSFLGRALQHAGRSWRRSAASNVSRRAPAALSPTPQARSATGMFQSSVSGPEIEDTGKHSAGSLKIFSSTCVAITAWVENFFDRAVAAGFNALCLTVDTAHLQPARTRHRQALPGSLRPARPSRAASSKGWTGRRSTSSRRAIGCR